MSEVDDRQDRAKREHAQLIRVQERMLNLLQEVLDELESPTTERVLREIRNRAGSQIPESMSRIHTAIEQAIRAVKVCESDLRGEILDRPDAVPPEGLPNLPPSLARFLAERAERDGFSYEVGQDPVRGWVITWKEYTPAGTVRGSGQFYERPYAWLED